MKLTKNPFKTSTKTSEVREEELQAGWGYYAIVPKKKVIVVPQLLIASQTSFKLLQSAPVHLVTGMYFSPLYP